MTDPRTTLVGIARIGILIACLYMWLSGKASVGEAALAMATLLGAAGSLGFIFSKDSASPEILATTQVISDDKGVRAVVTGNVEEKK